jgi:outer membrane protein OmpA-like peptidoglycan-associated protein
MTQQPTLKIEIRGHTDNIGNENYNKKLSIARAATVYNYLSRKGIAPARMKYRGFGTTVPVDNNDTESGRAKNRRVEVLIMEK